MEKEGQQEGSQKATVNQEGSNPKPVEVELKVREGTEIEFTEAYLKTASLTVMHKFCCYCWKARQNYMVKVCRY